MIRCQHVNFHLPMDLCLAEICRKADMVQYQPTFRHLLQSRRYVHHSFPPSPFTPHRSPIVPNHPLRRPHIDGDLFLILDVAYQDRCKSLVLMSIRVISLSQSVAIYPYLSLPLVVVRVKYSISQSIAISIWLHDCSVDFLKFLIIFRLL